MDQFSRIKRVITPLTDAATVTVDAALGDVFTHTGSSGRTIDGPTGGYDGQIIVIRSTNTGGGSITHTLDVSGAESFRYPAGVNALNPIPAGSVGTYVAQYNGTDARWDVLSDSLGTSNIAAGNTGEIQYNNAGAVAGAANVEIDGGNLKLVSTTDPVVAPSGGILLYSKLIAGRHSPKMIGPSGIDTLLETGWDGNSKFVVSPTSGTAAPSVMGGTLTTAATMSQQFTAGSTNRWFSTMRKRWQTSTTAGNATGTRTAYVQWFRGNAAGFGGFRFRAQLGAAINLNGGQKFVGLCASTGVLAGDPSALVNMCGMGYDADDASTGNWFFMRNDGSGVATKVDLGSDAARGTTQGWDLIMVINPNGSELFVRIVNLNTDVVVLDTSYTTDIPAVNTGMAFKAEVRNGAVAAADNLEIAKIHIGTDY